MATIIDLNTRIWNTPETLGQSIAAHLRRQKRTPWHELPTGIEAYDEATLPLSHAVIHGFESALLGASIPLEAVAEHVRRSPGRLLGFAGIDPTQPAARAKLNRAKELGLVGLTVSPSAQGFHPSHSDAMALFEAAADLGWPVLFESLGAVAQPARLEFDQPHLLDEVARSLPELKIIVGSAGDPFTDQALALLSKHPNVYAEVSGLVRRPWQLYSTLVGAYERGVISQLLFASGYPFCTPERAIVTLYSVNTLAHGTQLPAIPREQVRSIVERDTLSVLGLPARESADPPRLIKPAALPHYTSVREAAG